MNKLYEEYYAYDLTIEELYYVPTLIVKAPDAFVERLKNSTVEEIEESFQKTEEQLMDMAGYDKGAKLSSLLDWEIAASIPEWLVDRIEDGFFAVIATPVIGSGSDTSFWKSCHTKLIYAKNMKELTKIGKEWVEELDKQYEKEMAQIKGEIK